MKCILRLYITGSSLASQHAVRNLRLLCQEELKNQYDLEIIDILENPEIAESEKILATPTLVKSSPAPVRKVIGDLSQRDKVLFGLGLIRPGHGPADTAAVQAVQSKKEPVR